MVRGFISGQMVVSIRENGMTIICMGEESTLGKTAVSTKESIKTTANMALAYIPGRMVVSMRAIGKMANSTAKAFTASQME